MGMGAYLEQDWQNIIFEMGDGYLWVSLLFCLHLKMNSLGLPWRSSGWDSMLPLQEVWVQSLVRKLRSHVLHSQKKKDSLMLLGEIVIPFTATVSIRNGKLW